MKKKNIHCTYCGEKMFSFPCEAENIKIWHHDSGGGATYNLDSAYAEDGKRNFAEVYQCPQYKRRFLVGGNFHDIWCFYKGERYYPSNL